jgi:hypothetical protein
LQGVSRQTQLTIIGWCAVLEATLFNCHLQLQFHLRIAAICHRMTVIWKENGKMATNRSYTYMLHVNVVVGFSKLALGGVACCPIPKRDVCERACCLAQIIYNFSTIIAVNTLLKRM